MNMLFNRRSGQLTVPPNKCDLSLVMSAPQKPDGLRKQATRRKHEQGAAGLASDSSVPQKAWRTTPRPSTSTAAARSCVGRPAPLDGSTLDSSSPKMASASSQLNAVSHNRFTALATEDMDFCAGGNDTTTTDTINDQEVLRSTVRTAVAVRGNDLHSSDIAEWKISGKQVNQRLIKPQLNDVTQSSKPTPQFSEAQAKRMIARITKASRMPPNLPREEQKIVIRPRGVLFLAKHEADNVMSDVITAANVPKTAAKADTICTNPT
ncbi:hypothetical protein HPB51_015432 [Rhipicephalus microplus]|uniref:Uncharacterized protein n=1 Tax=Rhipicephalus microplus TaxID=6941 RepID=A0A9J6DV58_RHIMP|nr:hypothetical protein HPB51_015432 [Rhipicephalus microplus]